MLELPENLRSLLKPLQHLDGTFYSLRNFLFVFNPTEFGSQSQITVQFDRVSLSVKFRPGFQSVM